MTYATTWTNADAAGRLAPGRHYIHLSDAQEIAAAVNRRRLLTYQPPQDYSPLIFSGAAVRRSPLAVAAQPLDSFRQAVLKLTGVAPGGLGGWPPSPTAMNWLWPVAGPDEGKVIVSGEGVVGAGQAGLLQQLSGQSAWTDPALTPGVSPVRAVHVNELRQALEWLSRGRWIVPVYLSAGLFSLLPDIPWMGDAIANNGQQELRAVGFAILRTLVGSPAVAAGLEGVTIRPQSRLEIWADADCTVEVYRCLRAIEYVDDMPSWNEYWPGQSAAWSSPGGMGGGDAVLIGSTACTAGAAASITGADLTAAIQAMVDGAEQNLLFRRLDTGGETIALGASLVVEFDLDW